MEISVQVPDHSEEAETEPQLIPVPVKEPVNSELETELFQTKLQLARMELQQEYETQKRELQAMLDHKELTLQQYQTELSQLKQELETKQQASVENVEPAQKSNERRERPGTHNSILKRLLVG